MSVPPAIIVNPAVCPIDGRSYVLTAGHKCRGETTGRPIEAAPVVIWIDDAQEGVAPSPASHTLQILSRDGLSGFVAPMIDPHFWMQTAGATYTWTVMENTTRTTIDLFGTDSETAQRVIDSLRLANR
jgi:hypothetical protein